jgi:pectin methylesterase-like acyl-CoA thioesterase
MATEEQISALRLMVDEEGDCGGWDDDKLAAAIDASETLNGAAARVWYLKAGSYANLVDVSESGSSRKLSDLHKNATEMGNLYAGLALAEDTASVVDAPVVRRIRRTVA